MKNAIASLAILIPALAFGQLSSNPEQFGQLSSNTLQLKPRLSLPIEYHYVGKEGMRDLKITCIGYGLALVSGAAYGVREVVQHKPNRIPDNWNTQWWDTRESWKNKYIGRDPENERRFIPVAITDAYHLSGTVHRWTMLGSGVCIGLNGNNNWKEILGNAVISAAFFQVGFRAIYNTDLMFNP